VKIFISYSRLDASETAKAIHNYLTEIGHKVFLDTSNIHGGDEWWKKIQQNISDCDIFIIIVTQLALLRKEVEKEVELAKSLKKTIIPCIAKKYVRDKDLKWELDIYQSIKFEILDDLIQEIGHVIAKLAKIVNTKIKIYISYSAADSQELVEYLTKVFLTLNFDVDSSKVVLDDFNIELSNCDIFIVIVTGKALYDPKVDKEVLQAQRENKKIIPCIVAYLTPAELFKLFQWRIDNYQRIRFDSHHTLERRLVSEILKLIDIK
jgi:hypothetical protein